MTVLSIPRMAYNAVFTPMGRKRLRYTVKKVLAKSNPEYRKQGTCVYRLKNGNKFVLHKDNHLSELIYLESAYEPLETLVMTHAICPGDVVLDIGANVGYFTSVMDGLVKPGGEAHAWEPGAATFARLQETKSRLKLDAAVLHQKAMTDKSGFIEFWNSNSGFDAQQGILKNPGLAEDSRCVRVPALTMDDFHSELKARGRSKIAFIKCDIEGAELNMLKAATKLLNSADPPVWLLEHNREVLKGYGANTPELVASFKDCEIYFIPTCWPPTTMLVKQAVKWNGDPAQLPDECNLVIFPKRGMFAERMAKVRKAGLIP